MLKLVTADLHLNDNPRDQYRHDYMKKLIATVEQTAPNTIVILGDLTDEKDRHGAWLVNTVVHYLAQLAYLTGDLILLRGNHDYVTVDNPFYEFTKNIPGITWINRPRRMREALWLPHTNDHKRDWLENADLKIDKYTGLIFAHNTFTGAKGETGRQLEGIPPSIFTRNARIISGDIHEPQSFGRVTYVGAPYTVDFGDSYKPRMLWIDDEGTRSIMCTGPQKRLVEIATLEELNNQKHVNRHDIVKVRVHLKAEDYAGWVNMRENVKEWGASRNLVVHAIRPVVDKTRTKKTKASVTSKSDEQIFRDYTRSRSIDDKTVKAGFYFLRQV